MYVGINFILSYLILSSIIKQMESVYIWGPYILFFYKNSFLTKVVERLQLL